MLEAVSMMGEACLSADKYHTRKVCQERISQDLIDGEISSILARWTCPQNKEQAADTRIFSPLTVPRLCVTIGRYWYLFRRLTAVSTGRFYRFEHIVADSSGIVVAKAAA